MLVLGGGFAGVEVTIYLKKYGFDVTLVSDREYLYIYPISIWIPVSMIDFKDVCLSLSELQKTHKFDLVIDEVVEIKSIKKEVVCKNHTFNDFDYLVIAIGGGKVKHKGIENTLSICGKPQESLELKKRIEELISKGEGKIAMGFGGNPKDPSAVRGGPSFEVLFNVHNYLKKKKIRDKFELTFFAPMPKPGARMGQQALKMMDVFFKKLNINKIVGKKIKSFEKDGVVFEDDTKLQSDLTMFIAAGDGHPVIKKSDLPTNKAGFVLVNEYCEVMHNYDEFPEKYPIFAIGDSAALDGPDWRAKQGHLSEIMAKNAAFNILKMEEGSEERESYLEHINILCVMDTGDSAAFVYRNNKRGMMIPMPIFGHWVKKGWGWYFINSKLEKIPRIPGL